jgi:hypothetical protein
MSSGSGRAILVAMNAQHSYRIVVQGRLSERFASAFDGMELESADETTSMVGPVIDQAQLFGVLERVHSFGLELLRVEVVCP